MPVYVKFIQNGIPIRGSVSAGAHAGWTQVHGLQIPRQAGDAAPRLLILTPATDSSLLALSAGAAANRLPHTGGMVVGMGDGSVRSTRHFHGFVSRFSAGQRVSDKSLLGAEVHFMRHDGRGGEVSVLHAFIHGLQLLGRERISHGGTDVAMEKIVIAYEGMTRSGASASQDITQEVRTLLETYDYPGSYAQRFDGIDKGGTRHLREQTYSWAYLVRRR